MRGKIRTERTAEDRKYRDFIDNVAGNYNSEQVQKIKLKHTDDNNFFTLALRLEEETI